MFDAVNLNTGHNTGLVISLVERERDKVRERFLPVFDAVNLYTGHNTGSIISLVERKRER